MPALKEKASFLDGNEYYNQSQIDVQKYNIEFWDVSETISELSYLTHSYFRYYGKFPSKIGKLIIDDLSNDKRIDPKKDFVLDNYAGSGTTLVEAKLKDFDSFGIDINPFAVLACKVKTRNYDVRALERYWQDLLLEIKTYNHEIFNADELVIGLGELDDAVLERILSEAERFKEQNKDALKWFSEECITQLAIIKTLLLYREVDEYRDFFELGFFAIIRRVSTAHDGEVRPHVNAKKRKRDAVEAYSKKISEMIQLMMEWNQVTNASVVSGACLCNNANGEKVSEYIGQCAKQTKKKLGLVVSHPPYLNCFDYIPVFKLKFMWSDGFDDIFFGETYQTIKGMEIKSYPASSAGSVEMYFEHNRKVYQTIYNNLRKGGYCCIVIGDCTVNGRLFEVHKTFITMLEEMGFVLDKIAYRSTSYGIGQYAYKFRADYNEDANRKKDGVLFFNKP